ncbi:MAG: chromophore lyase CpcT/CpeT [Elainellaceae cyanobacterium]
MSNSQSLLTLAKQLAGEFANKAQSLEQPSWFVNLRLWHRPLPIRIHGHIAIFAEQANAMQPEQAYRQRVFTLQENPAIGQLQAQYFALKDPGHFKGAGLVPSRLSALSEADLVHLPGCLLDIRQQGNTFTGEMQPGSACRFQYDGKIGQVVLGFEVSPGKFLSYDRGVNPDTGKSLWGALMGPYEFTKCQDFSEDWA